MNRLLRIAIAVTAAYIAVAAWVCVVLAFVTVPELVPHTTGAIAVIVALALSLLSAYLMAGE